MSRILIILLRLYQLAIAPLWGNCCRFYPSCSSYCHEAISKHGSLKGLALAFIRLGKCHPFHPGGVDLVP
ncbi:MAG: membrane protein insertion efficiency factor YidD [Lentisphaerae bacterium]|nr:membrane protein insertion efficiency factor YidD [Lentisphaerota bacterium]